jgi:hypothetical protein
MVCLDDEIGLTNLAAAILSRRPVEYAEKMVSRILEACYKIKKAAHVYAGPCPKCSPNITMEEKGTKMVLIRGMNNEKTRITTILSVLVNGHMLPLYVTLWRKTVPKEKLPVGLVFRWHKIVWMINDFTGTKDQAPFSASMGCLF